MQVFPTTEALDVFANNGGSITLRQADRLGEDDSVIVIPLYHVSAVIRAIRLAAKEARDE